MYKETLPNTTINILRDKFKRNDHNIKLNKRKYKPSKLITTKKLHTNSN